MKKEDPNKSITRLFYERGCRIDKYGTGAIIGASAVIGLLAYLESQGDIEMSPKAAKIFEQLTDAAKVLAPIAVFNATGAYKKIFGDLEKMAVSYLEKVEHKAMDAKYNKLTKEANALPPQMPSMPWHQLEQNSEPIRASSLVSEDKSKRPVPIPRKEQKGK